MLQVTRFTVGPIETNTYLLESCGQACVIDPGYSNGRLLEMVGEFELLYIILTHGHIDHTAGLDDLPVPKEGIGLHASDADIFADPLKSGSQLIGLPQPSARPAMQLEDGLQLQLGQERMEVIHTPGHTPGCICLAIGDLLFSGDTLFAGSVGRTDLAGGSSDRLALSLRRLVEMEGDRTVYPGHGPSTTLERERRSNPFLAEP